MADFGVDHVHIYTDNITETTTFYKVIFGADEVRRIDSDNGTIVHLDVRGTRIVISKSDEGHPNGLGHFAMRTDNLDEALALLRQHDINISPLRTVGHFANVFIHDPSGAVIEIISPGTDAKT